MISYTAPTFPFASTYLGTDAARNKSHSVLLQEDRWWARFKDPVLNALVERALSDNLDLELARERINEARAQRRAVAPGLSSNASLESQTNGSVRNGGNGTDVIGRGTLSWLFDPWGGRAAQEAAADAGIETADAERDAAQLLLLSNLATAYVNLRFAEASLKFRHQELAARRRNQSQISDLLDAKAATALDLVRARAQVAQTQSLIPSLQATVQSRKTEIAILLGTAPGQVDVSLGRATMQPIAAVSPEVGLPADLIRNRPDIRIAERLYYAALANVTVARANLYPSLSLSGTLSLAISGGRLNDSYSFGPSLVLPSLPGDTRRAAVDVNESRARQAHTTWRQTVLSAIGDVESALAFYQSGAQTVRASERAVELNARSVNLTRELVAGGSVSVQELLDVEQALSNARIQLATARRDQGLSFVNLNVALGAGHGQNSLASLK